MSSKPPLKIAKADRMDEQDLVVEFSDMRTAVYGVEQLTELTPKKVIFAKRQLTKKPTK